MRGASGRGRTHGPTRARQADRYDLYQRSVQMPDEDVAFLQRVFRNHYGRPARRLREDFCGTALLACRWAASHRENEAWGVDLDPEPLAWGREHNQAALRPEQSRRVHLVRGDVRDSRGPRVDITVGFNFSFFLWKTRPELLRYFRAARTTLRREGLFVIDAYGGGDSQRRAEDIVEHPDFEYVWDQYAFDPISHHVINYIHFRFPDGSRIQRAFRYDWRLWTLPELRELLEEAGFSKVEVYWEGTLGDTEEGNGIFTLRKVAPDDPAWITYIVAVP
jgi:SAM-dependent methyltransferase